MARFSYPFEPGGPERVVVDAGATFRSATVAVDGVVVGYFPNRRAFRAGASFPLKGGGELHVQFKQGFFGSDLKVFYEGRPLHVLGKKPPMSILAAGATVMAIGILTLIAGSFVAAGLFQAARSASPTLMFVALLPLGLGVAFVIMGIFVRKGSFAALLVATVFYAIDLVSVVYLVATTRATPSVFQIVIKLLILIGLANGLRAFREMRQMRQVWARWQMQAQAAAGMPAKMAVGVPIDADPQPPAGAQ